MSEEPTIIPVEYRTWNKGIPPRRTKLEIGGWAGENTWKSPQPWHCKPYSDASTYTLELIYPWDTTCEVTCDENGKCHFKGDFTKEKPKNVDKTWEPFGSFAPYHFGYVSMVDIKTPKGYGLMVQPHPRVYADKDGSTPVAVPGILEMDWWPEIFFIVFKAPLPGCKYIFKKGDPVASFMIVPKNIKYEIEEMSMDEQNVRATRQGKLENNWNRMCTRVFYCEDGVEFFDNKYKVLSNIAKRDGIEKAQDYMDKPETLPHWDKNPSVVDHRPPELQKPKHSPRVEKQPEPEKYEPPILPQDFWKDVPIDEEDKKFVKEGMGELEEMLNKTEDFAALTDAEMHNIITAFKREKRKARMERTLKLKGQSQPSKLVPPRIPGEGKPIVPKKNHKMPQQQPKQNQDGEWILGHKMEKLI